MEEVYRGCRESVKFAASRYLGDPDEVPSLGECTGYRRSQEPRCRRADHSSSITFQVFPQV